MRWKAIKLIAANTLPLVLFAAGLWFASAVYAAPQGTAPSDGSTSDVAIEGPNAGIQAPESDYEITTDASYAGTVDITIAGACVDATAGSPGLSATITSGPNAGTTKNSNSNCSGNDLVFNNIRMGGTAPQYSNQLKTLYVKVDKINGQGHQPFKVKVAGGGNATISYEGDPNRGNSSFSGAGGYGVFPADPAHFRFTPDCSFSTSTVYLKWQDADTGASFQSAHVNVVLQDYYPDGSLRRTVTIPNSALGGNGAKEAYPVTIFAGDSYDWQWSNLAGVNAIQVWVPFSQNSYDVNLSCGSTGGPHLPSGSLSLNCPSSQYTVTGIKDLDDGTSARSYRVGHGGSNTIGNPSSGTTVDKTGSVYGNATGSLTVVINRTYYLQVKDDDGTWINTDSAVVHSCTSSGNTATCTTYSHAVGPHSNYKFTVFPITGVSITTPAVTTVTGSAPGAWATFSVPAPYSQSYQAQINSNTRYSDAYGQYVPSGGQGTFTLTFPPPSGPDWVVFVQAWTYDSATNKSTYGPYREEGPQQPPASGTPCYSANCSISIAGNVPGGGSNDVQAGSGFGATATIQNTGLQDLTVLNWSGNGNAGVNPSQGVAIGSGVTSGVDMSPGPTAPATEGAYSLGGQVYAGSFAVAGCPAAPVNVYQHFTLVPTAGIDSSTSPESPTSVTYDTGVTQGPDPYIDPWPNPVAATTHSILYYQPYGGAQTSVDDVPNSDNYGNKNYVNTYNGPDAVRYDGAGGDQFCPAMTIDNATGWIGPGGELDQAPATSASGCLIVSNRPFFKVYNGSASAGGAYKDLSGNCSGGGLLAGWNNDSGTYPNSADFGASAQIGALALGPIIGFASNQSKFGNDPTSLSFANSISVDKVPDSYSPKIGGNFNTTPGAGNCFADVSPDVGVAPVAGPRQIGTVGSPTTLTSGQDQSVFVTGDVYISSNVLYVGDNGNTGATAAWASTANVPSYVVHATGNIYIDPSVTELDGLYEAEGKIFTCGVNSAPYSAMPLDQLYAGCHNQLTVYGNFVATQMNLARTFGSLRNETPNPSVSSGGTTGATAALAWSYAGPVGGDNCARVYEPSEPNEFNYTGPAHASNGWVDNYLCVPPGDGTGMGQVQLSFTCDGWAGLAVGDPNHCESGSPLANCVNVGNIIEAAPWNYPTGYAWADNQLCSNYPISFVTGNSDPSNASQYCTLVNEPADTDGNGVWQHSYVCIAKGAAASFTAATPYLASPCSNQGIVSSPQTCAAEVFYSTPELYMASPKIGQPSGGAPQWTSVTSLPPLL